MSEIAPQTLSGVSETLLITLYIRALESQRPDAMLKDEKAVELVAQGRLDFSAVRKIRITEMPKAIRIILTREIDRYAREFLAPNPRAVVVHIGCGLDTRFERVDNGRREWYDLDLPGVSLRITPVDLARRPSYTVFGGKIPDNQVSARF